MNWLPIEGLEPDFYRQVIFLKQISLEVKSLAGQLGYSGDVLTVPRRNPSLEEKNDIQTIYREVSPSYRNACGDIVRNLIENLVINSNE